MDISQTIVSGYFNMMMIVDTSESQKTVSDISNELGQIGEEIGVLIQAQNEDIFNTMHRI